ncbi:ferritin-like domain-containing protein [Kordia sp.]|uniref:ferritin-like domain-containing protein n=1 Tax=Kordia sp. TaxID=1965332 RepID=UPI003D29CC1A
MKTYTKEVGSKLNTLLEKNYDAQKGYKTASENAQSIILTNFFERKSKEREQFADQLKSEITKLAQEPETTGSIAGIAHRTWMNTKALFSSDTDEAMLAEAIRGEKASIEDYNDVLNAEVVLPQSIQNVLSGQRNTIVNDTLTIKRLEDIK